MNQVKRLVEMMARLRGPEGCPWDREQDYRTLRKYVLEEAFEVAEALDEAAEGAPGAAGILRGELGDLLLQVVFLARIAEERGEFDLQGVARAIADKLERRHPHVFGDEVADTAEEVWTRWETIKAAEREGASLFDGVPRTLPALIKALHLTSKAARVGFAWVRDEDVLEKLREEADEFRQAADDDDPGAIEHELGDLLFVVANLARRHDVDAERALQQANRRFEERMRWMENRLRQQGRRLDEADLPELEELWEEAKGATRPR
jgi:tetrapyrrole methylase family protein/MazG family protein/ATP diphosphatase